MKKKTPDQSVVSVRRSVLTDIDDAAKTIDALCVLLSHCKTSMEVDPREIGNLLFHPLQELTDAVREATAGLDEKTDGKAAAQ
jgi:hypothetical protein